MKWADAIETVREDLIPFGAAPGGYFFPCRYCEKDAIGAKRSWRCEPCAIKAKADYEAADYAHWEKVRGRATD